MTVIDTFGRMADGMPVDRFTMTAFGMSARIMTWGAVLQDLRLEGVPHSLVLGFNTFHHYPERSANFGAIVGRVANRIRMGRAEIGGRRFKLDRNFLGRHTLHGGADGTGNRLWQVREIGADFVTLGQFIADGHMGFPGNLDAEVCYRISEGPALEIDLVARADADTICNLAPHNYFNLDGTHCAWDHLLQIDADTYLPVDDELIPTGEMRAVAGTPFDFRQPRALDSGNTRYDHNYCLSSTRRDVRPVATLTGSKSGLSMAIETGEPGLQLYDGAGIQTGKLPGLNGAPYGPGAGIALEPQAWPDGPNQSWSQQVTLLPHQIHRQRSVFRFRVSAPAGCPLS